MVYKHFYRVYGNVDFFGEHLCAKHGVICVFKPHAGICGGNEKYRLVRAVDAYKMPVFYSV